MDTIGPCDRDDSWAPTPPTPIYYVNGAPHLGHAYTAVLADALARHHRQLGERVRFVTGTDEHGLKVQRAAEAEGLAPKALADKNAGRFRELFARLGLSNDRFIRTTDADHLATVEAMVLMSSTRWRTAKS